MSLSEGLNASASLNGTVIALLSEVTFECNAAVVEWVNMGSTLTSDVMHGARKFKGHAQLGYVDNTYLNYFVGGSVLAGTIFPRGGTSPYIGGSVEFTNWKLSNMKHDVADPVLNDIDFIMYDITKSA